METLEARIEARLNEAFDRQVTGGFYPVAERGLVAMDDPDDVSSYPPIRLSIADVARIAAQEARAWL